MTRKSNLTAAIIPAVFGPTLVIAAALPRDQDLAALFSTQIRPILTGKCGMCHNGSMLAGGLDLSSRKSALKGSVHGLVLVPGKPEESKVYQMVASGRMPPGSPVSPAQMDSFKKWIALGAEWPDGPAPTAEKPRSNRAGLDWWSLKKPIRRNLPPVKNQAWVRNPIDAFVLAKLEQMHLAPAPAADRTTLIRRATFDLTGLPPTPEEIDAFLRDRSPDSYEKLIDRLLASPHYGERWGRHWLDVARYSESQGFERDIIRDHAWRFRDYVIRSFNEDKPYDRFVEEQIAGDVLEPVTHDGIIATGFLVCGPWDEVGNTVSPSALLRARVREEELEDMISAVSQTFLAMTVNCARCHDHKFDQIPQRDYYRIRAVFDGVRHGDRMVITPEEKPLRERRMTELNAQITDLQDRMRALEAAARARVLGARGQPAAVTPAPIARWGFDGDFRESQAGLDSILVGSAKVAGGQLKLDGSGAYLRTGAVARAIREKTMEAWVSLGNLTQRGGGVVTIETQDGSRFDSIVFGEREPGKWIAGSDSFRRTRDIDAPAETTKPGELVHVAVTYQSDGTIAVYRNGRPYGSAYNPGALQTYEARQARLVIGMRHTGSNAFLAGEIEEVRLYDRALGPAEIAASFKQGVQAVSESEITGALTPAEKAERDSLRAQLISSRQELKGLETVPLTYAGNPGKTEPGFVLIRGDVESKGEPVTPGGLSCAGGIDLGLASDAPEGERRLRLAKWIATPANPLTARVIVNRVWRYHFGRGIVDSPSDFGFNGDRPSHAELLDWLAGELVNPGISRKDARAQRGAKDPEKPWSLKRLHRVIMLSSTYRQSARFSEQAGRVDSENRYLWRFTPRRLEGEEVRDAMLSVSGQLNPQMGGPSFRPFTVFINNSHFYTLTDPMGPEFNRRSIYRMNVNSAKSPLMETLDCPDPSTKTPKRSVTTTALQALALMNNSFVLRQAKCFAERVKAESGANPVIRAYLLAFGRQPTATERASGLALAGKNGIESLCWALLNSSEFLYVR